MNKGKRKIFPTVMSYQGRVIFSVFIPALILHLSLFGMLTILNLDLATLILKSAPPEVVAQFVDKWSSSVILISLFFVGSLLIIIFVVSRNMVGAFDRILSDLDQVVEGKSDAPITAREYDSLAQDLLKRINLLIEQRKQAN